MIIDSRAGRVGELDTVRRRRRCEDCKHAWYTIEVPEERAGLITGRRVGGELTRATTLISRVRRLVAAYDQETKDGGDGARAGRDG